MKLEEFEGIAKPGDLVVVVVDEAEGGWLFNRWLRVGIYDGPDKSDDKYCVLRTAAQHFLPDEKGARGWDCSSSRTDFAYSSIQNAMLVLPREKVADFVDKDLSDLARADYLFRFK